MGASEDSRNVRIWTNDGHFRTFFIQNFQEYCFYTSDILTVILFGIYVGFFEG